MGVHILLFESDSTLPHDVKRSLRASGFNVIETGALTELRRLSPSGACVVIAVASGSVPCSALAAAVNLRHIDRRAPFILLADHSSEQLAIEALRAGVTDYLKQPVSVDALAAAIHRCLGTSPHTAESVRPDVARVTTDPAERSIASRIIGDSFVLADVRAQIAAIARTDTTVLITGETGAGKELAAELVHEHGSRRTRPFAPINCAAIPETLLESELFGYERGAFTGADSLKEGILRSVGDGTVFFDEVGDLTASAQAKILRAVESKEVRRLGGRRSVPVGMRIIAATNRDLEALVKDGSFREDLYFRLNVARIHLPPLREHKEDIPALARHYIGEFNRTRGKHVEDFAPDAVEDLLRYDWPGNVRELRNVIEAAFVNVTGRTIAMRDLPAHIQTRLRSADSRLLAERDRMLLALHSANGNKSEAAIRLRWSRMTLYRKMAQHRIGSLRAS